MSTELTANDFELMLAEIRRFCQRSVRPLVERPEQPIEPEKLDRLTDEAVEVGLLNFDAEPAVALWENLDTDWGVRLSTTALGTIARASAGVAFHFHQLALGAYVGRCLGLDSGPKTIACLQGDYGLARYSLARLLRGRDLAEEDRATLYGYFVALDQARERRPLLFQAAGDWQRLAVPCLDEQGRFVWAACQRDSLHVEAVPHSHGLDETQTWRVQLNSEAPCKSAIDSDRSLSLYSNALQINAQAVLAIALGAVRQGYDKATEYAAMRVQGGRPIDQHVTVQKMLASCLSTIETTELVVRGLADLPLGPPGLARAFRARAQAHDQLCGAANDVLQAFGGMGYVRETGLEKIVRDINHLRLVFGTRDELLLFLSEWEADA
jgi:alkylation response protein AidB-like acyl-CoA dehydrogenase